MKALKSWGRKHTGRKHYSLHCTSFNIPISEKKYVHSGQLKWSKQAQTNWMFISILLYLELTSVSFLIWTLNYHRWNRKYTMFAIYEIFGGNNNATKSKEIIVIIAEAKAVKFQLWFSDCYNWCPSFLHHFLIQSTLYYQARMGNSTQLFIVCTVC